MKDENKDKSLILKRVWVEYDFASLHNQFNFLFAEILLS